MDVLGFKMLSSGQPNLARSKMIGPRPALARAMIPHQGLDMDPLCNWGHLGRKLRNHAKKNLVRVRHPGV